MPANSAHHFERFLTLADVADILNVELDVARSLVESNELAAIRIGRVGQWRIEQRVLEDYIQDQYERQRREALFAESQFDDIPELSFPGED
ncbi:MAG: helix-turn-helix domain-containing protein [Gulosibacter sp.]|uniref:helix-turn-helix domain-containing protein n=1 Tax=Gulosibacter sp. TaxID=2817531 RepID=UPI003F8EFD03